MSVGNVIGKRVKRVEEFAYHNPMFSDKVLPIANKAVTNTDAGRVRCDVENFDDCSRSKYHC
jgi:hypothetical protein